MFFDDINSPSDVKKVALLSLLQLMYLSRVSRNVYDRDVFHVSERVPAVSRDTHSYYESCSKFVHLFFIES